MIGIENIRKTKNTSPIMETIMVGKKEKVTLTEMEVSQEKVKAKAIKEEINPVKIYINKNPAVAGFLLL